MFLIDNILPVQMNTFILVIDSCLAPNVAGSFKQNVVKEYHSENTINCVFTVITQSIEFVIEWVWYSF
jgi:hypothetical protein